MHRLISLAGVLVLLALPSTALASSMTITPLCVDDAGELVWSIDVDTDGTVTADQGGGQSITTDVQAGSVNEVVVGLVGQGPVTFTFDGVATDVDGSDQPCAAPEPGTEEAVPTGGISTTGTVGRAIADGRLYLPPTDTAGDVGASVGGTFVIGVLVGSLICSFAFVYAVIRSRYSRP